MALEQKKAQINHKKGSVNQRILQLKMKLNDQVRPVCYVLSQLNHRVVRQLILSFNSEAWSVKNMF